MVPQGEHDGLESIAGSPAAALPIVVFGLRELRMVQHVERLDAKLGRKRPNFVFLMSDPSMLNEPGPRMMLRPASP